MGIRVRTTVESMAFILLFVAVSVRPSLVRGSDLTGRLLVLSQSHATVISGAFQEKTMCVVDPVTKNLRIANVIVERGDTFTMRNGRKLRFSAVYRAGPPLYLHGGTVSELILIDGNRYSKFEGPRRLSHSLLRKSTEYRGTGVFVESEDDTGGIIYIPYRPGCEFQPYEVVGK